MTFVCVIGRMWKNILLIHIYKEHDALSGQYLRFEFMGPSYAEWRFCCFPLSNNNVASFTPIQWKPGYLNVIKLHHLLKVKCYETNSKGTLTHLLCYIKIQTLTQNVGLCPSTANSLLKVYLKELFTQK